MPLTGEFRPSVGPRARSAGPRTRCSTRPSWPRTRRTTASGRSPASRRATRSACARRTRSTSTTCCSRRCGCSTRRPTCSPSTRRSWRYLHVDEYQDTNRAQYLWVRALAATPPQPVRRRRRRPVDLLVARRRPAQHPRLRARLARHRRRQARAELPLDPADPRRRPRGRVAQHARARTRSCGPTTSGGVRIQRFEAYNEEEEAEWIARQVEGLVGGRGTTLTRRADEEDARFRARDIAVMYRMNAQSRAIEESFLRYGLRYQLVGGHAVLLPARGQGRPGLPAHPALGHRQRQLRADHQRAGARHRRQDDRDAARRGRARGRHDLGRHRGGRHRRAARPRAAHAQRAGRVRDPRPAAAHPGRRAEPARAARRGPRGVRLPGDARRRLGGRRGALGEPARAARGHDPLRRPDARTTRSTACSRRRRSSPTRTRTRATPTRSR